MPGVLALPVEPETAIRSGPEPWLIRLDDAASEMHYAAALIETWLRGGVEIGGRRQRVKPGDIAVLYPRRRPDAAVTALCDRLNGFHSGGAAGWRKADWHAARRGGEDPTDA